MRYAVAVLFQEEETMYIPPRLCATPGAAAAEAIERMECSRGLWCADFIRARVTDIEEAEYLEGTSWVPGAAVTVEAAGGRTVIVDASDEAEAAALADEFIDLEYDELALSRRVGAVTKITA